MATLVIAWFTWPAWAGYSKPGYDLTVVASDRAAPNSAIDYQLVPLMTSSGRNVQVLQDLTLPSCRTIGLARLYLDIWGGTSSYTATVQASLNGVDLAPVSLGGAGDTSPVFDVGQTCVYGSGSGMWQVAFAGIEGLLKTDGTPNTLSFQVSDPSDNFDGRTISASLVSIYSDPGLQQTLDFDLAEADGTLRASPGTNGSPAMRTLALPGIDTSNVLTATYTAGYTHGTTGTTTGKDQIYFNGASLGGSTNDATKGNTTDFGPNKLALDVTTLLAPTNTVKYSVSAADVGSGGDTYLRANVGLLSVAHPAPQQASAVIDMALDPGTSARVHVGVPSMLGVRVANTAAAGSNEVHYWLQGDVAGGPYVRAAGDVAAALGGGDLRTVAYRATAPGTQQVNLTATALGTSNRPVPLQFTVTAYTGHSTWSQASDGSWGTWENWDTTGGIPQIAGDTADFGDTAGTSAQVTLDGDRVLSGMQFSSAAGGYTIAPGSGGTITLVNGGQPVPIAVADDGGRHTIQTPLQLSDDLAVNVGSGSHLTLSETITGTGKTLTKSGVGELILSGSGSDFSSTTVNDGRLVIASAGAIPDSVPLVIQGGMVELSTGLSTAVKVGGLRLYLPRAPVGSPYSTGAAVPEPGTLGLLAAAAVAGFLASRRRSRKGTSQ